MISSSVILTDLATQSKTRRSDRRLTLQNRLSRIHEVQPSTQRIRYRRSSHLCACSDDVQVLLSLLDALIRHIEEVCLPERGEEEILRLECHGIELCLTPRDRGFHVGVGLVQLKEARAPSEQVDPGR
jgi:hypothetical protein